MLGNKQSAHAIPNKRGGHVIRPASPKSSIHSAFGSKDGSEEDDNMENDAKLDDAYLHTNGHFMVSAPCTFIVFLFIFILPLIGLVNIMLMHSLTLWYSEQKRSSVKQNVDEWRSNTSLR